VDNKQTAEQKSDNYLPQLMKDGWISRQLAQARFYLGL
jgi:hypothetical protein